MALTFKQAVASGFGTTSLLLTITSTLGSLLLVYAGNVDSNVNISDGAGNIYKPLGVLGARKGWLVENNQASGSLTILITDSTATTLFFFVAEYTGQSASPFDVAAANVSASSPVSISLTTNYTNEQLIYVGRNNAGGTLTFTDGSTARSVVGSSGGANGLCGDRFVSSAGQQTGSFTFTGGAVDDFILVGIKTPSSVFVGNSSWTQAFRDFANKRGLRG